MLSSLKSNLALLPGWRTNRKIVVIESDDWGSIRMSSTDAISEISRIGYDFNKDLYGKYDSLASEEDLNALFEVLNSVRDKNNNPAVLTANAIMANPDFEKIKASNFEEYHYEIFTETFLKYPRHNNSYKLWKDGMANKLFHPQFHGREHVNVQKWLKMLRQNDVVTRKYFDFGIFGLRINTNRNPRDSYMRALDYEKPEELSFIQNSLVEGLKIFEEHFGFRSNSFIAPSYVWNNDIEQTLAAEGVKYLQGIRLQYMPVNGKVKLQSKLNYTGKRNQFGQYYIVRNAFFEPTLLGRNNSVENVMKSIQTAFLWKKPVQISTHRINFIGFIDERNRTDNLELLKLLLHRIVNKWPSVEFMTSDQLGELITQKK